MKTIHWTRRTKIFAGIGSMVVITAVLLIFTFVGMPWGGKLFWLTSKTQVQPSLSSSMDVFIRMPLSRQAKSYTCGVADMQSILYYYDYGEEIREDILARELKSNPDIGTNYNNLIAAAQSRGIQVEVHKDMTIDELKSALRSKKPVMVAIQAWGDNATDYANDWNDGHWAIAVGYDDERIYFMDPSTLGNFTYIAIPEFLTRWHDTDSDNTTQLIHFGLIFSKDDKPSYDPNAILPLSFVPNWFGIGLGNAYG